MTKEEFDRRVALLVNTASGLLGGSGTDPDSPAAGGMTQGEAIAFYEKIIEDLDVQLEKMAQDFYPPPPKPVVNRTPLTHVTRVETTPVYLEEVIQCWYLWELGSTNCPVHNPGAFGGYR